MKFLLLATMLAFFGCSNKVDVKDIRDQVKDSVVRITGTTESGRNSGGTGFIVITGKGKRYIITNRHICELRDSNNMLKVEYPTQFRKYNQRIIEISEEHDLCLVESLNISSTGLRVATELSVGENVFAVGHPKLYALTVSKGQFIEEAKIYVMMSAGEAKTPFVVESLEEVTFFQLSGLVPFKTARFVMYSRGGNSGSAIVNEDSEVISVLFAGNRSDVMETYGVPLRYVQDFISGY